MKSSLRPDARPESVTHFEELRRRFFVCLAAFAAAMAAACFFSSSLLDFLIAPLQRYQQVQLIFQKPHEAFVTHLKAAGITGLVVSLPVLFSQAWLFVSPALYDREKRIFLPLVTASAALFTAGACFAFFVVVPLGLHFLLGFQTETLKPFIGVDAYFAFLTGVVLVFGFLFDLPLVLLALVRLGVIGAGGLARARPFIIVSIFVLAAVFTPPDPFTQVLLAVPLWALFEISLALAWVLERRRGR